MKYKLQRRKWLWKRVVEEREVVVEEVCNPCCDIVIDESINGLIVEMDDVGNDW